MKILVLTHSTRQAICGGVTSGGPSGEFPEDPENILGASFIGVAALTLDCDP